MRKLLKYAFILGYFFWGGMFLYSASLYITYNGFGNSFTYNKIVPKKIKVEESENNYHIIYSFEFNNRIYENDERVIKELYLSKIKNQNEILISFNNIFPELNFVQQFNLALRNQKIGMVVSIIGILFFFILDFFADKNYWLDKYHKFFNKIQHSYVKILREYVNGEQEKFLTTHHERDVETGLDYRGARFYDADVARFLSLDPLAKKYSNLSPYNYVAGNPLIFIDSDGKEIQFAAGSSKEFLNAFSQAVNYLIKNKTSPDGSFRPFAEPPSGDS